MPVQMKLSERDPRLYSPDRDLAYCGPNLIKRAIYGLDYDMQEPWVKTFCSDCNITEEELADAAHRLAEYINNALLDSRYNQPYEALEATGFFELRPEVQHIVCAKMGQVFLSAVFPSIRDVIKDPTQPHYDTEQIADIAHASMEKVRKRKMMPRWRQTLGSLVQRLRNYLGV